MVNLFSFLLVFTNEWFLVLYFFYYVRLFAYSLLWAKICWQKKIVCSRCTNVDVIFIYFSSIVWKRSNWMISTSAIYLHRTERFPLAKRRIIVSHAKRGRLLWIRHLGMYLSKTKWSSWEKQDLSACWKKGFCFRKEIETVSEVKLLRATQFDPIFIS